MPTSTEFIGLCRTQISLVSSWGATLSIVYLTEKLVEGGEAKLVPIIAYPETSQEAEKTSVLKVTSEIQTLDNLPKLSAAPLIIGKNYQINEGSNRTTDSPPGWPNHLWQQCQIVLPLIHDGVVMGLLVTAREDRPWNQKEKSQIQQVAHTIAIASILDQRSQWLKQEFQQQQQLQVQQFNRIQNILHQLKSPLTALRTFGKLLLKGFLPKDKNWNIANSLLRESDRLREFIEQIDETVDVGEEMLSIPDKTQHFQSTTPNYEIIDVDQEAYQKSKPLGLLPGANFLESVSVQQVLEPLLISTKAIANESNIGLQVDFPDSLPIIKANYKALREVLSNIIDNALKYTPIKGNIYIKLATVALEPNHHKSIKSKTEEMLVIAVSDTGYGISSEDLEHLFERNYRGEKAKTNIPGTGLGLVIARDLINEMQGKIQVYSPVKTQWLPSYLKEQDLVINGGTTVLIWLHCEY
ncbi:MAG: GAF domain-containing sensor histidine kinase [Trichodesmium sp. St18_bin1]|jgi:Osmosensitive K+ channel histidine kinase|nr:GAF domain-containing sensor histidine kinase [Trichodesmium sp. St18_bin1]MDE5120861.1 GAF domain-containing sensor histidine kinase [Trichodesmium sp. St19_bin1]